MKQIILVILATGSFTCSPACSRSLGSFLVAKEDPLVGLWEATRRFGPEIEGGLSLERQDTEWILKVGNQSYSIEQDQDRLRAQLPQDRGSLSARILENGEIIGHWTQPPLIRSGGRFASPIWFVPEGENRWRADLKPREDRLTFWLVISRRDDGKLGAFLRNPERNLGVFHDFDHVVPDGESLTFMGRPFRSNQISPIEEGTYHPEPDQIHIQFENRGGLFVFERVTDRQDSAFYPRGKNPTPWTYTPPTERADGWETATLEDVAIDEGPLREMIEALVQATVRDIHAPYPHAILIARDGALVFEEYFHGYTATTPHDTRSASKSVASVMTGAMIQSGVSLSPGSRVYETVMGSQLPSKIDPRKEMMTLEHLLTMSSGFDCDDNTNAPGSEDVLQSQTEEPDWYRYTLALPMVASPGKKPVYSSATSNLAGAVLAASAKKPLVELFQDLIATPLEIHQYHLFLQPTGEPYFGGGSHFCPRDFLKLGQLMLNGGTWKGQRILGEEWVKKSSSHQVTIDERAYGYLWWLCQYPYGDSQVRAYFAAGNGGQIVMVVPDLDLVVGFFAGNYSDRTTFIYQNEWMPKFILPAVGY